VRSGSKSPGSGRPSQFQPRPWPRASVSRKPGWNAPRRTRWWAERASRLPAAAVPGSATSRSRAPWAAAFSGVAGSVSSTRRATASRSRKPPRSSGSASRSRSSRSRPSAARCRSRSSREPRPYSASRIASRCRSVSSTVTGWAAGAVVRAGPGAPGWLASCGAGRLDRPATGRVWTGRCGSARWVPGPLRRSPVPASDEGPPVCAADGGSSSVRRAWACSSGKRPSRATSSRSSCSVSG
jgi:hypothetical protein